MSKKETASNSNVKTLATVREEYSNSLAADAKEREVKIKINGAKMFLRQIFSQFDGDVKEALEAVVGTGQRGGGGGATRTNPVKACIAQMVEKVEMSNIDCFMAFNKGPAEMRELMKYGVRNMPEDERVWIKLIGENYTVVAVGPISPEGWDGYEPVQTEMDL